MILEQNFKTVSDPVKHWFGTSYLGEDLRAGRGCRVHILPLEPTATRLETLSRRLRRLQGVQGCLGWRGHGRVMHKSLYVAEELHGEALDGRRLEASELKQLAMELLDALGELHARGLVHGVLGPELVYGDGSGFRLGGLYADLGWGGQRPEELVAPESRLGLGAGAAADLYSLGATLVRLGTGATGEAGREELDGLLGLGDLLLKDPDLRPSAQAAGERLRSRGKRKPAPERGEGLAAELARRMESGGGPLALWGAAEDGPRFLLEAVACELRDCRPVWLEADPAGGVPLGLARAALERLGGRSLELKEDERSALKSALEDALERRGAGRPVLLVAGFEQADGPSRRMLAELCSGRGSGGLLTAWEGAEPQSMKGQGVRQGWRWGARHWLGGRGEEGPTLERQVEEQHGRLSGAAQKLLEAVAVAPPGWQLEELAAVAEAGTDGQDAADELVQSGLVLRELDKEAAERYRMAHPRLGALIEKRIEAGRAAKLHRSVAELLELITVGQDEGLGFLLHYHLARAGAVRPGLLAGLIRRAAALGDIERARELVEQHPEAFDELEVLTRLELLELADDLDAAAGLCRGLLRRAAASEEAVLRLHLGGVLRRQSDFDAAYAELGAAWELRMHLSEGQGAALAMDLAHVCSQLGRLEETMLWLERVAPFVQSEADPGLLARYLSAQADVQRRLGRGAVAVRELRRARELLAPSHPDLPGLLAKLGRIHVEQGAMEEALEVFREALAQARAFGRRSTEEVARFNVAWLLVHMERVDAAAAELEAMLLAPLRPTIRARALGLLGTVAGMRGRLEEARELFGLARGQLGAGDASLRLQFALDEALLLLDHGQPEIAEGLLSGLEVPPSGERREAYLASSALMFAMLGQPQEAAKLLEDLGQSVDPVAWEARGELLLRTGAAAEAVEALEAGLRVQGPLSSGYRRGMLLVRQARALLRAGRNRRSALVLRQGLEKLQMAPALAEKLGGELEQELKSGGARTSRAYLEALLSLSELLHRQRDARSVERLILEGILDILGPGRVRLVVYHPVTAAQRVLTVVAGGEVTESGEGLEALEDFEPVPEPQIWASEEGEGRLCSLLVDAVPVGHLVLEGLAQEEGEELQSFLRTYSSLAALALARAAREEELLRRSQRVEAGSAEFLVGRSAAMLGLMADAQAMAGSDSHILILGESGVGKTQLAREIHRLSRRRAGPFFQVDLASEPQDLVSSNLFGHEKGAFTGAAQAKEGYIAAAQGGTLFLDEIGDIRPEVQQKLLLFLQSKTYRPMGSNRQRTADVRVILATNKELEEEISGGRFRRDLYYRLSSLVLHVPALRERREDIRWYCEHFFRMFCRQERRELQGISPPAMAALVSQAWPGNLRDLMNCLQRAVLLAPEGGWIEPLHLSLSGQARGAAPAAALTGGLTLAEAREALDRKMLLEALEAESYNRSRTARRLGVTRQGLLGMMRRYEIEG